MGDGKIRRVAVILNGSNEDFYLNRVDNAAELFRKRWVRTITARINIRISLTYWFVRLLFSSAFFIWIFV